MAYTATKTVQPKAFQYPLGNDNDQRCVTMRGNLFENDTATEYSIGGFGSTSFEVTAFSAVGLVTYSSLTGVPLVNGQLVVIYNTSSNTNDGTFTVSNISASSSSAGTFTAVPLPGKTLSGTAQTTQTAEGVGQVHFGVIATIAQTFTVASVTFSGGVTTYTYTTLVGPQLFPTQSVIIAGMTNAANNGTFTVSTATPTSSTAGSFTVLNPSGVATDSGTGTGQFPAGNTSYSRQGVSPIQVTFFTSKGYSYQWNRTNNTIQVFLTGASSGAVQSEAALGATLTFDNTITFEAIFLRG